MKLCAHPPLMPLPHFPNSLNREGDVVNEGDEFKEGTEEEDGKEGKEGEGKEWGDVVSHLPGAQILWGCGLYVGEHGPCDADQIAGHKW